MSSRIALKTLIASLVRSFSAAQNMLSWEQLKALSLYKHRDGSLKTFTLTFEDGDEERAQEAGAGSAGSSSKQAPAGAAPLSPSPQPSSSRQAPWSDAADSSQSDEPGSQDRAHGSQAPDSAASGSFAEESQPGEEAEEDGADSEDSASSGRIYEAPLLSLIPPHPLAIDEATLKLAVNISDIVETESTDTPADEFYDEPLGRDFTGSLKIPSSSVFEIEVDTRGTLEKAGRLEITMKVKSAMDSSDGYQRLLSSLSQAHELRPLPKQHRKTRRNQTSKGPAGRAGAGSGAAAAQPSAEPTASKQSAALKGKASEGEIK